MKIVRDYPIKMALSDFAEEHDLTLRLRETDALNPEFRYCAKFDECLLEAGSIIYHCQGFGRTEEKAIADYAKSISKELLVFRAWSGDTKKIRVPILTT